MSHEGTITLSLETYEKLKEKADKNYTNAIKIEAVEEVKALTETLKNVRESRDYYQRVDMEKRIRIQELETKLVMRIPVFLIGLVIGYLVKLFI